MSLTDINFEAIQKETSVSWPGIEHLRAACLGLVIFDLETLSPEEEGLFTTRELEKFLRMGRQRRKSFKAARVALKILSRRLGLIKKEVPDYAIETLGPDNLKPCLAESGLYCSVSHSSRFVVAVAHRHPVGVDIEGVSDRIQRIQHIFLSPGESQMISQSGLDFQVAATLVWSIKEAAAKALGLHLFQAVREVRVVKMGKEESSIRVQEKTYPARHIQGHGQVIALVTIDDL
ncbi:MAG: 4'-phosphopantetheinyl transferase superfamily protein [Deltaproteobacteria bacterium]|nr:4'-phosphopantetheinyl transferase superfamily protein [Deltaproteobacteria bacterium]